MDVHLCVCLCETQLENLKYKKRSDFSLVAPPSASDGSEQKHSPSTTSLASHTVLEICSPPGGADNPSTPHTPLYFSTWVSQPVGQLLHTAWAEAVIEECTTASLFEGEE